MVSDILFTGLQSFSISLLAQCLPAGRLAVTSGEIITRFSLSFVVLRFDVNVAAERVLVDEHGVKWLKLAF